MIGNNKCSGLEDQVNRKLADLTEQWEFLVQKSTEKSLKLKEATKQQTFNAGVKDIEFWLGLLENQLSSQNKDYGKDLASVQNLIKKHQLIEADLHTHQEQIDELNGTARQFAGNESLLADWDKIGATMQSINERYEELKRVAQERKARLQDAYQLHQFIRDLDDEEAWIKEKKLLVKSEDLGRDLNSVHNLKKKHKRLEAEINTHEQCIDVINEQSLKYKAFKDSKLNNKRGGGEEEEEEETNRDENQVNEIYEEIEKKVNELNANWIELKRSSGERASKLDESLDYHQWVASVDEERSWMNEKQHVIGSREYGDSLASVQGLMKKHDAFETDFNVHKHRCAEIEQRASALVSAHNCHAAAIDECTQTLLAQMRKLESEAHQRQKRLDDNWLYLQFLWKSDVVESWIGDKQKQLHSLSIDQLTQQQSSQQQQQSQQSTQQSLSTSGHNLSSVQNLLAKHDTFDAGLQAFQSEGIETTAALKDKLCANSHTQSNNINKKYEQVIACWNALIDASKQRRDKLLHTLHKYRDIEELYLKFAKKASSFNSWFENAEEDLTDPVRCNSIEEIDELMKAHERFSATLLTAKKEFDELKQLDDEIKAQHMGANPYTWFTMDTLRDTWRSLEKAVADRQNDLNAELQRQQHNDAHRQVFAQHANQLYACLSETRNEMIECSLGSLEQQLQFIRTKSDQVKQLKKQLKVVEELGSKLEERLVLDNRYTEHSTLSLAQAWDQLDQLGMRMQHNLEQQIQARNQSGVSEESLREFSMMFKHFDKDKTGKLDHDQFKNCLRALGYDLPIAASAASEHAASTSAMTSSSLTGDGASLSASASVAAHDEFFNSILDIVDPNRDGFVNLQEFMAFMISRETENISSQSDVINAFKALTENGERAYITKEELLAVSFGIYFLLGYLII